ncbi:ferrous iron transport protein B [Parazoarcus communis]|uniref:Ferrous iron transport protein B n=1 Tax=Parazoarcus communis SWub3 = DSM 12120 TaxID=1121029 RepID=A0A323V2N9_9RHOO|nr:ferrous iron transport protein B [Parazoarcus communis]NMG69126.1 ferrous iron transport protein B [Parazoarcus communis SWub3 = DSM 12120]PZA18373.1 ferrous iron transport protein B [Azoarcus communis] [Parazoarcus communis SWub3 = DSM 12120]
MTSAASSASSLPYTTAALPTIALVGHPNVGKSVLFHRLTGTYVNVSNYPGTTVEVARAPARFDRTHSLLDTPGVLALPSRSDDERATVRALLNETIKVVVQVGDAKNLRRTLNLTALLAELGVPMAMALNMTDEAQARGVTVDTAALANALAIPVVATVATGGSGVGTLTDALSGARVPAALLKYDDELETHIDQLTRQIETHTPHPVLAARGLAILLLGGDSEVAHWIAQQPGHAAIDAALATRLPPGTGRDTLPARLARERSRAAEALARTVSQQALGKDRTLSLLAGQLAVHRIWGWPLLLVVLYLVYLFVGDFGAGTLVGLLEEDFFGEILNPAVTALVQAHVTVPWLADLLVGDYGLWTMGMTYALALILPIVTTFFLAFGILEDSGYFTRLSVIANRMFAAIGLNGRAVLPMVLGLGCVTMATLTTRILHTPRERLITTFLMALAIPCSAQLGVVLGLLGGISFGATLIWVVSMVVILLATGWLAGKLVSGRRVPLLTELPPMRMPLIGNVLKKTGGRLKWYLMEVIPLFLIGTLIMFVLDRTGALPWLIEAGKPLVTGWLGLPPEASAAFVMGFLRRDFGATGLFALESQLSMVQAVVGMVTITLFVPCIASVMMIVKEQGLRTTALMLAMIMPTAFLVGGLLNHTLRLFF